MNNKNLIEEIIHTLDLQTNEETVKHLQNNTRYCYLVEEYNRILGYSNNGNYNRQKLNEGGSKTSNQKDHGERFKSFTEQDLYLQGFRDGLALSSILKECRQLIMNNI